jgi:2-oxoisovalerate dehydrogenase E1 component alpha subunit
VPDQNEESADNYGLTPRRSGRAAGVAAAVIRSGKEAISAELALTIFRQMLRTRALEERSIKMSKSGEAYFWIGGPGEEAINVTAAPASSSRWGCRWSITSGSSR